MNDHLGKRARDLTPDEESVAHWFEALERHDAPAGVRAALMASERRPAGRLLTLPRVPFGAWGLASAAMLLLALGAAVFVELNDPIPTPVPVSTADRVHELTIVEDGRMALFHAVETFDDVGLEPGRLIADWGR